MSPAIVAHTVAASLVATWVRWTLSWCRVVTWRGETMYFSPLTCPVWNRIEEKTEGKRIWHIDQQARRGRAVSCTVTPGLVIKMWVQNLTMLSMVLVCWSKTLKYKICFSSPRSKWVLARVEFVKHLAAWAPNWWMELHTSPADNPF